MADPEKIIPENRNGIQTNTESSVELETEEEAKKFFEIAKGRLLDINKWHECAGSATADFQLTDEKGNPVDRKPKQGDHFRIDIQPLAAMQAMETIGYKSKPLVKMKIASLFVFVRPLIHRTIKKMWRIFLTNSPVHHL
jgi:hypothetical protein